MMNQIDTSNEYDNESYEKETKNYQLEIKEIWTPNLAIAKYNINEEKPIRISISDDEDIDIERKEEDKYYNIVSSLREYLYNMVDFDDRVIFSSNNLKEIMKPGDIIQTKYKYNDDLFKLNENTTLFIFYAYKALYPKILAKNIKSQVFDQLKELKRPGDHFFFRIYTILRAADISFMGLRNVWQNISVNDREKYFDDINAISNNLERDYSEYIYNFFIHHFPFDEFKGYVTKEIFDKETIISLIDKLEPLRIMMKNTKKKKEDEEDLYEFDEEKDKKNIEIKPPKGGNIYKDFDEFKNKVIESFGRDHPLIKAHFNYKLGLT